jgi:hypothetical protein
MQNNNCNNGDSLVASPFIKKQSNNPPFDLPEKEDDPIRDVLKKLSDTNVKNDVLKKELLKIYKDEDFRHSYSDITMYLFDITTDNYIELETIVWRIKEIVEKIDEEPAKKRIFKLYDHLNLELVRIKYLLPKIQETNGKIQNANQRVENLEKLASSTEQNVKDTQKNYITILGIFASIIIAFVANMSFSASVLQNIDKPNTFKLVAIICFLGVFIVNILNLLFNFVREIYFGKEDNKGKKYWSKLWIFNATIIIIALACLYLALDYDKKYSPQKDNNSTINFNITAPRF